VFKMAMFPGHHICLQSFPQNRQLTFCCTAVDELQQAQALVVGNSDHGAERRVNSLGKQRCARLRIAWRFAKNFSECFAKTALRRLVRSGKKIDVLAVRFFGTARRSAENSGRAYADVKDSFKARVALYQCAIHRFRRRKKFERLHRKNYLLSCIDASTKFEQQIQSNASVLACE